MERNYECMLILKPDLSESERDGAAADICGKIKDLGGQVVKSELWAKIRDFYYFLKSKGAERKKYYKGAYWLVNFSLPIEKLADLKEFIRLEERVLRNLMLNRGKDKLPVEKVETTKEERV